MKRSPWSSALFPLLVGAAVGTAVAPAACAPPRRTEDRAASTASSTDLTAPGTFEGSASYALLAGGVETDVAGELTIKVPSGWIAKQALERGHAHFTSRDGRVVVTVTDTGATAPDDATVLHWATRPWMKLGEVTLSAGRATRLGRSALVAEEGAGSGRLSGEHARLRYARIERQTSTGSAHVLVMLVTSETSTTDDRARGQAAVRSLGLR